MTTSPPRPTQTVGQIVAERPERGRVFERLGIDYCCGGRKPLAEACAQRGLKVEDVRAQLAAADRAPTTSSEPDWTKVSLSELADHIGSVHHETMRRELPRLAALVRKVAGAHGRAHPALMDLDRTFAEFSARLMSHMETEESTVFPWIRGLESGAVHDRSASGPLDQQVRTMMSDHDDAGRALAKMRELTNDFAAPAGACGSYLVMLSGLRDLVADMHMHVHKENNILFPRALALEAGACSCDHAGHPGGACKCAGTGSARCECSPSRAPTKQSTEQGAGSCCTRPW